MRKKCPVPFVSLSLMHLVPQKRLSGNIIAAIELHHALLLVERPPNKSGWRELADRPDLDSDSERDRGVLDLGDAVSVSQRLKLVPFH